VRHEVVHNKYVVDNLRNRGAVFVDELDDVPSDGLVIFSAHGVAKSVQEDAKSRGLKVFDATCPLVTKVHMEVLRFSRAGKNVVLIGHQGHPEVEGTMGQFDASMGGEIYLVEDLADVAALEVKSSVELCYVTQTTLSVDDSAEVIAALENKFPQIQGPKKADICYATQNRQDAVKQLALECNVVLVVGSPNSSNSNRLRELAERCGATAFLVDNAEQIDRVWMQGVDSVGVTAGASAPEKLVQQVVKKLESWGGVGVSELDGEIENVFFSLPKELRPVE